MSPLSLVSHGAGQNHRMLNNPQMGLLPNDLEQRMFEYIKMFQQQPKEARKFRVFILKIVSSIKSTTII